MKKSKHITFSFAFTLMILVGVITFAMLWFPTPVSSDAEANQTATDIKAMNVEDTYDAEIIYSDDVAYETPALKEDESTKYFKDYSYDDVMLLATLVYLEAGIENDDSQRGVASVVLNRAIIEQTTLEEVIYAPYQFTPANKIPYTTPSQRCIDNALYVLENGTTLPRYVTYFRADYYFNWGNRYKQYTHYDHTYFSYDTQLYDKYAD